MKAPLRKAIIPIVTFLTVCTAFALLQSNGVNLIRLNFDACHYLHGLVFPLALGYLYVPACAKTDHFPLRLLIAQIQAVPILGWPQALVRSVLRDLKSDMPWSPWAGACLVGIFATFNEVIIDPYTNGIPFTSAYSNLVADLLGIGTFLVLVRVFTRGRPDAGSTASTV